MQENLLKDTLNIQNEQKLTDELQPEETIVWSGYVNKRNNLNRIQQRKLALTQKRLINFGSDSFFYKLTNCCRKSRISRGFRIKDIERITVSTTSDEIVLHVPRDVDYNITNDANDLLKYLLKIRRQINEIPIKFYFRPEQSLNVFTRHSLKKPEQYPQGWEPIAINSYQTFVKLLNETKHEKASICHPIRGTQISTINFSERIDFQRETLDPTYFEHEVVLYRNKFSLVTVSKQLEFHKEKVGDEENLILEDKKYYVINQYDPIKFDNKNIESMIEFIKKVRKEINDCGNKFILELEFTFKSEQFIYYGSHFIQGGSLRRHLVNCKRFNLESIRFYFGQILLAMSTFHEMEVVYNNLVLENVQIDKDGYIKVCGFTQIEKKIDQKSLKLDYLLMGIILYEMAYGKPPLESKNINKDYKELNESTLTWPNLQLLEDPKKNSQFVTYFKDLVCLFIFPEFKSICLPETKAENGQQISFDLTKIRKHPFFSAFDFSKLKQKVLEAPYIPIVDGILDVRHFDEKFTQQATDKIELSKNSQHMLVKGLDDDAFYYQKTA